MAEFIIILLAAIGAATVVLGTYHLWADRTHITHEFKGRIGLGTDDPQDELWGTTHAMETMSSNTLTEAAATWEDGYEWTTLDGETGTIGPMGLDDDPHRYEFNFDEENDPHMEPPAIEAPSILPPSMLDVSSVTWGDDEPYEFNEAPPIEAALEALGASPAPMEADMDEFNAALQEAITSPPMEANLSPRERIAEALRHTNAS